ncbi:hypothetical protein [[Pseudomonas] boreopolis]|uniref:Uncharacterized protein n=1 Tax=Xanthomonas boreopolis TaxID=86183 RepID=A0A919F978_9XANT|nr:hypothetical protein GCM10009090_25230 [[Pseudomonas] boreopolis]
MGVELAAAAGLGLLGGGLNYINQRNVVRAQDRQLASQIQRQAVRQEQADAAVNDLLAKRAVSTGEPERMSVGQQYLDQVRAAQAAASRGLNQSGAVSDAYRTAANDAALGIGDYGQTAANLMARIDAPRQQRVREGLEEGDLRSRLGLIGREAGADDYLSQLRLQSIRENPWLSVAAQVAQGAAGGIAANGFGSGGNLYGTGQVNAATAANNNKLFQQLQAKWGY